MVKKLYSSQFVIDNILFSDHDSGNVPFSSDEMGILSVGIHEDDTKTNINVRLLA